MISDCLDGIRVLDLSQYLPGPYATQLLADLGADVVKIEPPHGDPGRAMAPFDADGIGKSYKLNNGGKRRIALDLKSDTGKAAFAALAARADVVLESYRPGVMDRLGFGRPRLEGLNTGLIVCSLSGFGQTGPLRDAAGHDVNYLALAGALALVGTAEDGPTLLYPPVADRVAGMTAALAILGALIRRGRTGRGAYLDIGIADAALAWQQGTLTSAAAGEVLARERLAINGGAAFYNIYRTADGGFVTLGPIEPKFWRNFCDAVGRPDWIERQGEPLPQTALIGEVRALFESQDRAYWERMLGTVDCCFMPVYGPDEVAAHPHWAARGTLVKGKTGHLEVPLPSGEDSKPASPRMPLTETDADAILAGWN